MFRTQKQKDLFEKFDCVPTPGMEDFEIIHSEKAKLVTLVK
jgi:hypothetical protein